MENYRKGLFLTAVIVFAATFFNCFIIIAPAQAAEVDTALLIQQTPVNGGTVSPGTGVYNYSLGDSVPLTATPEPGYHFVCWLGDVADTTINSTTVNLDTPKIIIAVFERVSFDFAAAPAGAPASDVSYAKTIQKPANNSTQAPSNYDPPVPDDPKSRHIEIVEEPIPEPATLSMMGFGVGLAWLKRKKIHNR